MVYPYQDFTDEVYLAQCELVFYQTAIMAHKVMKNGLPAYLDREMKGDLPYRTRQATTGGIRFSEEFFSRKALNPSSFRHRSTVEYYRIPGGITETVQDKEKAKILDKGQYTTVYRCIIYLFFMT